MTLQQTLADFVALIRSTIGNLTGLNTTAKTSVVDAINEVKAAADQAVASGIQIDDVASATTTVYSSSKTESVVATAKSEAITDAVAQATAADLVIDDSSASGSTVYSSSKTASEISAAQTQAVADAVAQAVAADLVIDDATASLTTLFSAQEVLDRIQAAITTTIGAAPEALDTIAELAAALNDDASFHATVSTALGNRLRFDAAQTLTAAQKTQGQANLGVSPATDVQANTTAIGTLNTNLGDVTVDLVALYNAA